MSTEQHGRSRSSRSADELGSVLEEGRLVESLRPDVGALVAGRDELGRGDVVLVVEAAETQELLKVSVARGDSTVAGCEDDAVAVGADGSEWASCQPASAKGQRPAGKTEGTCLRQRRRRTRTRRSSARRAVERESSSRRALPQAYQTPWP